MRTARALLALVCVACNWSLSAQTSIAPTIQLSNTFGGSGQDDGREIIQTRDNGFLISGTTLSNDGQVSGLHDNIYGDILVIKTNSEGTLQWEQTIGGTKADLCWVMLETEYHYLIGGYTDSKDGDFASMPASVNENGFIAWLNKSTGTIERIRSYSGDMHGEVIDMKLLDKQYIIATGAMANVTNKYGVYGGRDVWVAKMDTAGNVIWERYYGGSENDWGQSIIETKGKGFTVSAYAMSEDGDVSSSNGGGDAWMLSLDADGQMQWEKSFGGPKADGFISLTEHQPETEPGTSSYLLCGYTASASGNVQDAHGGLDYWAARVDASGNMLWSKCFGGTKDEYASGAVFTKDKGALIYGWTKSTDGDAVTNNGIFDALLVRIDKDGNTEWTQAYGSSGGDFIGNITLTCDNSYAFTMTISLSDNDVVGKNWGNGDIWLAKLNADGLNNHDCRVTEEPTSAINIEAENHFMVYPNPASTTVTVDIGRLTNKKTMIALYDATGRMMKQSELSVGTQQLTMDISNLPAGFYHISAETDGKKLLKKLVIQ